MKTGKMGERKTERAVSGGNEKRVREEGRIKRREKKEGGRRRGKG